MGRRGTLAICLLLIVMLMSTTAATASTQKTIGYASVDVKVILDGKVVLAKGLSIEGRAYVPVRAMIEGWGGTVDWDNVDKVITAYYEGCNLKFLTKTQTMTLNGARVLDKATNGPLEVDYRILKGTTYVPARVLIEGFGFDASFDANQTLVLEKNTGLDETLPLWSMVENFVPPEGAKKATEHFSGTLHFSTTAMHVTPTPEEMEPVLSGDYSHPWALWNGWGYSFDFLADQDPDGAVPLYELDATLFPGLEVQFFTTEEGDLVPVQRGIIRKPVKDRTESFWEIIIGPGKVWLENEDPVWKGWNKAAFPFSLVQSQEGEALIGLAFFYYKNEQVSKLYVQVSNDTGGGFIFWDADFNMKAWAEVDIAYTPNTIANEMDLQAAFTQEKANRLPMKPLSELGEAVSGMGGDVDHDNVLTMAMLVDDVIYYSPINTPFGEYPYPYGMRVGVWSVSKSLIPGIAALRLAQKYGTDFLETKIVDYFKEGVEFDYVSDEAKARWEMVTINHALRMTTGMGPAGYGPNWASTSLNTYQWAYSYDLADQIRYYFNQGPVPDDEVTGPGQKFYYMDQDMWIATLAMERFLKEKEGPDATILNMLVEEVFKPIGVDHFATGTSYTETGEVGFPYSAWGVLPTIDYLAKAGRLIANMGMAKDGTQILSRALIEDLYTNPEYQFGFWKTQFTNETGDTFYIPTMSGAGGNYVLCMPNGIVGIALGYNSYNFSWNDAQKQTIVEAAYNLKPF